MKNITLIQNSFRQAQELLEDFVSDRRNLDLIAGAGEMLVELFRNGGKVLSCGNGGSLCDAMHFAEELTGRFRNDREALPAMALADPAHLSCVANDMGYEEVFARMIQAFGKPGDVLLTISTSGNSPNILKAIAAARDKQMKVIGLTGKDGGKMKEACDITLVVPWKGYSDRIQEVHIKIIHILIEYIEQQLFSTCVE